MKRQTIILNVKYIAEKNFRNIGNVLSLKSENLAKRKTRITQSAKVPFFGGILILKPGDVNNLYSDIQLLYNTVMSEKRTYSACIHGLFRMSLRLLCETAARELGYTDIKNYISTYFKPAKKRLSQDITTMLSSQNVKEEHPLSWDQACLL